MNDEHRPTRSRWRCASTWRRSSGRTGRAFRTPADTRWSWVQALEIGTSIGDRRADQSNVCAFVQRGELQRMRGGRANHSTDPLHHGRQVLRLLALGLACHPADHGWEHESVERRNGPPVRMTGQSPRMENRALAQVECARSRGLQAPLDPGAPGSFISARRRSSTGG